MVAKRTNTEHLRELAWNVEQGPTEREYVAKAIREAADTIESLQAEVERLRGACRKAVDWYDANLDMTPVDWEAGREWTDPMMEALGEQLP